MDELEFSILFFFSILGFVLLLGVHFLIRGQRLLTQGQTHLMDGLTAILEIEKAAAKQRRLTFESVSLVLETQEKIMGNDAKKLEALLQHHNVRVTTRERN